MNKGERRTLGIDPGFGRLGYVVITARCNNLHLLACGTITTPKEMAYTQRLLLLSEQLFAILDSYQPAEAAVQKLFFGRNTMTAISVAQACGVALLALAEREASIEEYTSAEVKPAVTGFGAARKEQVCYMVRQLLNLLAVPKPDDAADAAAIAICHAYSLQVRLALPP